VGNQVVVGLTILAYMLIFKRTIICRIYENIQ